MKYLEDMIENLINLLHEYTGDKINNGGEATKPIKVPQFTKDFKIQEDTNQEEQNNQNTTETINNDTQQRQRYKSVDSLGDEEEKSQYSILKSQKMDNNAKLLSQAHTKPLILKSPRKYNSTLKKVNDQLSRTELQLILQDNQQPLHSRQKLNTNQSNRTRNNSMGISQSSSQSPVKFKHQKNRILNTEENILEKSLTNFHRFNTTQEVKKSDRYKSQTSQDFTGKPKSQQGGMLNNDHILYMELEAYKLQINNTLYFNSKQYLNLFQFNTQRYGDKKTKWTSSGSPNI